MYPWRKFYLRIVKNNIDAYEDVLAKINNNKTKINQFLPTIVFNINRFVSAKHHK